MPTGAGRRGDDRVGTDDGNTHRCKPIRTPALCRGFGQCNAERLRRGEAIGGIGGQATHHDIGDGRREIGSHL